MGRIDDDAAWTSNSWRGDATTMRTPPKPVVGLRFARRVSAVLRAVRITSTLVGALALVFLAFSGVRALIGEPATLVVDPTLVPHGAQISAFLGAAYAATWAASGYVGAVVATTLASPHGLHETYTRKAPLWAVAGLLALPLTVWGLDTAVWWGLVNTVPTIWPDIVRLMSVPVHLR